MSKKAKGEASEAPGKAGKAKSIGMALGFALLGAVAGPKVLGAGSAPAGATEEATTTTVAGPVIVLDAITLNLADSHMLQVGLALELSPDAEAGGGHSAEGNEDDPTKGYAKAIDLAISVFGDETMGRLSAPGGREAAKGALEAALHEAYEGEIAGVYFHQFVMQ